MTDAEKLAQMEALIERLETWSRDFFENLDHYARSFNDAASSMGGAANSMKEAAGTMYAASRG